MSETQVLRLPNTPDDYPEEAPDVGTFEWALMMLKSGRQVRASHWPVEEHRLGVVQKDGDHRPCPFIALLNNSNYPVTILSLWLPDTFALLSATWEEYRVPAG